MVEHAILMIHANFSPISQASYCREGRFRAQAEQGAGDAAEAEHISVKNG
ncbi:MAG: hypothetical protein NVS3B14_04930 [Ktedonobacteraceae bacterium]